MSNLVGLHHDLELELCRLRLMRDLGHRDYRPELEDEVLDAMESVWYRMTELERRDLEIERAARKAQPVPPSGGGALPASDVRDHARLSLPPRIAGSAA